MIHQVTISNTNSFYTVILFQVFLPNTNNFQINLNGDSNRC